MAESEIVIGWYGGAAEPRVITIWDEDEQQELIEAMNSIETNEDLEEVIEEYIYEYDCEDFIWDADGEIFIGDEKQKWSFKESGEDDVTKILLKRYEDEPICIITFDCLKASGNFPTTVNKFDPSELKYDNGSISYKGEDLEPEDNRGISSEKYLVKLGKIITLKD
ncbi:MAG: hypothetical protein JJ837_01800 [Prochlorococcus marinus XMU1428]|nr:hypothetical protein [Prochlorococcus marinus XMU1428]